MTSSRAAGLESRTPRRASSAAWTPRSRSTSWPGSARHSGSSSPPGSSRWAIRFGTAASEPCSSDSVAFVTHGSDSGPRSRSRTRAICARGTRSCRASEPPIRCAVEAETASVGRAGADPEARAQAARRPGRPTDPAALRHAPQSRVPPGRDRTAGVVPGRRNPGDGAPPRRGRSRRRRDRPAVGLDAGRRRPGCSTWRTKRPPGTNRSRPVRTIRSSSERADRIRRAYRLKSSETEARDGRNVHWVDEIGWPVQGRTKRPPSRVAARGPGRAAPAPTYSR